MFLKILCCIIRRKTQVLKSLFNNIAGLKVYNFTTRDSIRVILLRWNCQIFKNGFYRTALVGAFECELLNSSSRFFYLNECYGLLKFSAVRSISQYRNSRPIYLHYISMTQLAGEESATISLFNNIAGLKVYNFTTRDSIRVILLRWNCQIFKNGFYRTALVGAFECELLNSSSRFFYLNECYGLLKFSAVRSISQYRNSRPIYLHYISMTQLAGEESATT